MIWSSDSKMPKQSKVAWSRGHSALNIRVSWSNKVKIRRIKRRQSWWSHWPRYSTRWNSSNQTTTQKFSSFNQGKMRPKIDFKWLKNHKNRPNLIMKCLPKTLQPPKPNRNKLKTSVNIWKRLWNLCTLRFVRANWTSTRPIGTNSNLPVK